MDRHFVSRCVLPCCVLPVSIGMLVIAVQGVGGAQDAESVVPEVGEEAPVEMPADAGAEVDPVELPADGTTEVDPDLVGEKPLPGEEGEDAVAEPSSEDRWWSLMGGLAPDLPADEELGDDPYGGGDLFGGDPDAFENLDVAVGPMGLGGAVRNREAFDAGILRSELLSGGFQSPLERQGFRFGVGVEGIYDSNIYLDETDEVSDFSLVISPSVEYRSAPAGVPGQVMLRYTPFIRMYLDETDLNTVDHAANGSVSYAGPRGSFQVAANYGQFSNADRNYQGRKETESFSVSASAAYQLASRTSLEASFSGSTSSDTDQARPGEVDRGSSDNRSMQFQLAGYWQATAKTRYGPSARYSKSSSDTGGDRDAMAFLMVADWVPRDELSFSAGLGVERSTSEFSADSTDPTGNIGVDYRPNDRISLGADLSYQAIAPSRSQVSRTGGGTQSWTGGLSFNYFPNPLWTFGLGASADSYPSVDTENSSELELTYTASVSRVLPQGSVSLSGSLGSSSYDSTGPVTTDRDDEDYYSASLSYRRPVFAERGNFHSSLRWSDNSGGSQDWSRIQFALGMDIGF